jgi:excinuclease ABC subunit A
MRVVAASDHVIDIGPGAGEEGGHVVATGSPEEVARVRTGRTAPFLARYLGLPGAGLAAAGRRAR